MIHALQHGYEGQNEEYAEHAGHESMPQKRPRAQHQNPFRPLHDAHLALHAEPLGPRPGVGNEEREDQDAEREDPEGRAVGVSPLGASLEHPAHPDRGALAPCEIKVREPDVERAFTQPVERGIEEGAERAHDPALAGHVAVEDVAETRQREDEPGREERPAPEKERGKERETDPRDGQMVGHDAPRREIAGDGPEDFASLIFPVPAQASSSSSSSPAPPDATRSPRGAPPTTTTNSPRGGSDSTQPSSARSVPRRVSSNFLVSSREIDAGRSPRDPARSRRHSRSRCGDSKKMSVRGSSRNSSRRARLLAARRGRYPSNANRSVGSPATSRAQSALEGPGTGTTGTPAATAARTSVKAGSEIPGEPASETIATELPEVSFPISSGVRRSLLWSW